MTRRAFNPFTCPKCKALYQVVEVEAGRETIDRELTCQVCGGPLASREGKFVQKYFFLREVIRRKHGGANAVFVKTFGTFSGEIERRIWRIVE
jgi:transcription elongation factor Elf1